MPGDIEYAQSKDICVMEWKDRGLKSVSLISNMHIASESIIVKRKKKKGEKIAVKKLYLTTTSIWVVWTNSANIWLII